MDGIWYGWTHLSRTDTASRQKLFWWRQGYDWRTKPEPKLTVTGRRLDAEAAPLIADTAANETTQPSRMIVGIGFPTVGCWEITGKYGSDVLTFVVWITSAQDACDPRTLLPLTDPAYSDAMELAATLNRHDISVRCVLRSKEAQMFEGQLGAAFFRSNMGNFEALFLPRPETWDELRVVEQRETGSYTRYYFQGAPRYAGTWEGRSVYFVRHENQLLHTLDQQMAAKLRDALERE